MCLNRTSHKISYLGTVKSKNSEITSMQFGYLLGKIGHKRKYLNLSNNKNFKLLTRIVENKTELEKNLITLPCPSSHLHVCYVLTCYLRDKKLIH
jgi:hypothetical protein